MQLQKEVKSNPNSPAVKSVCPPENAVGFQHVYCAARAVSTQKVDLSARLSFI